MLKKVILKDQKDGTLLYDQTAEIEENGRRRIIHMDGPDYKGDWTILPKGLIIDHLSMDQQAKIHMVFKDQGSSKAKIKTGPYELELALSLKKLDRFEDKIVLEYEIENGESGSFELLIIEAL